MPNAFDSANYPSREPARLVVGDRWAWKRADLSADYPTATYSLKYSLRLAGTTASEIEITAAETGGEYVVEVPSATTAAYTAGTYLWQAYIVRTADSERVAVGSGVLEVENNADADTSDPRSHARKVLDAIEAVIESRASKDQEEYSINGRSLKRTPMEDLMKLRNTYRAEVRAEDRRANGNGSRKLLMRF